MKEKKYDDTGEKILVVGHKYIIQDSYVGKPITDGIRSLGAVPIYANYINKDKAIKKSDILSPTCKWKESRELLGSLILQNSKIDGVVLVSAFPCNVDPMVNEIINRKIHNVPVLNLTLDGQTGIAGLETRLESFIDIIRFKGVQNAGIKQ